MKISEVFNMDCMEGMARYPDNHFDLAIIDPPYGIGEDGLKNHSRGKLAQAIKYTPKNWDSLVPDVEYFKELKRVSKNQIIFGANHFIENIPNANSSCWIVWNKMNTGDFADCELAYCSFDSAVRKFDFMWNGMLQQNMKDKEIRIHPTQKPVALYDWILSKYAKEGDLILDTHAGSMSSVIAAIKSGNVEITAFELDREYFEAAKKRVQNFQSQTNLFQDTHEIIWNDTLIGVI